MLRVCTQLPEHVQLQVCLCITRACDSTCFVFFFFNDTATTEIYTLSLHDALPISRLPPPELRARHDHPPGGEGDERSEEHTSELQSQSNLVCRLLLEKKNLTSAPIINQR